MLRLDSAIARVSVVFVGLGVLDIQGLVQAQTDARGEAGSAATLVLEEAATCEPGWLPTFGQAPGVGPVLAVTVFDDGSGPALYVGGYFTTAGGLSANSIAKWDGS